jgi:hypothetical protein
MRTVKYALVLAAAISFSSVCLATDLPTEEIAPEALQQLEETKFNPEDITADTVSNVSIFFDVIKDPEKCDPEAWEEMLEIIVDYLTECQYAEEGDISPILELPNILDQINEFIEEEEGFHGNLGLRMGVIDPNLVQNSELLPVSE